MSDTPWSGDVVGLVEAFRAGERSPSEELEATLAAVEASDLNAVCHVDAEAARVAAAAADVSLPYGGIPLAVKELLAVGGWPASLGSLPLADEVFDADGISVERLKTAGAIAAVQTTSSEFGATNQTTTKIHGATRNPWNLRRTPGGSSGGSAAGVAGGLFALATASDGGGSIRIPAGFCGLIGLKSTFGRIPADLGRSWATPRRSRAPSAAAPVMLPATSTSPTASTLGTLEVSLGSRAMRPGSAAAPMRSVRCGSPSFPTSAAPSWGRRPKNSSSLRPRNSSRCGMQRVEIDLRLPKIMGVWGATGGVGIRISLGDRWPECAPAWAGSSGPDSARGHRLHDRRDGVPKAAEPSSTVPWR